MKSHFVLLIKGHDGRIVKRLKFKRRDDAVEAWDRLEIQHRGNVEIELIER